MQPRWLKIKAAANYSSIGENRLKELAEKGKIIGFSDPDNKRHDWIFDRLSLDAYREKQIGELELKATEIMRE